LNGYLWLTPRGCCIDRLFMPPSSTFALCFSFCFIPFKTGLDSWTLLGNQTINLNLTGAVGLTVPGETYSIYAIATCNAYYTYGSNGTIGWSR